MRADAKVCVGAIILSDPGLENLNGRLDHEVLRNVLEVSWDDCVLPIFAIDCPPCIGSWQDGKAQCL